MKLMRINFNFANKCPNNCRFCYVPFNNKGNGELNHWQKIIERINELNIELITFGGGDPLYFDQFYNLLEISDNKTSRFTIDTCGLFLNKKKLSVLEKHVELIGIPIDGPPEIHDKLRNNSGSFNTIKKHINILKDLNIKLQINTIATKINITNMEYIAEIITNLNCKWEIFQFWPIGPCLGSKNEFGIDDMIFKNTIFKIIEDYPNIQLKAATYKERNNSYFFVTSIGDVYCVNTSLDNYCNLGSIFDKNIIEKWSKCNNVKLNNKRANERYNDLMNS